ncbi:heme/copper-type cytochrome/quinol oxidase subunit 2 [Paenibacillus rhizosphaerae]|uniref:Heme/copper-type cytochrome/quinol oxidase subunit 2 n=2 Tax=Paenibacillus rhizosphaerae TaxID=297318 RepID=A0A839TPW9_9BACL|nr:heme/copper-type cytochrome/quinol oxidase subunit 2 [Paenibacillus rhizosphaerae]
MAGVFTPDGDYNESAANQLDGRVNSMVWLMVLAVIVLIWGLFATMRIGQSPSNKEQNPQYFQDTGKKWLRLLGFYGISIVAAAIIIVILIK